MPEGLFRELKPGPLAPEARIMPLDQTALYSILFENWPGFPIHGRILDEKIVYTPRFVRVILAQGPC